jgi:hypothetical protein
MRITNKDLIQSYVVTTARYEFSIYEKRILYRIIETCQHVLEGKKLTNGFSIEPDLFKNMRFKMPISYFLNGEKDKNHARIKTALKSLRNKTFEYETNLKWKVIGIIEKPEVDKYKEHVEFEVSKEVYEAILNFNKGFRKFELKIAMKFKSVYSMRFYELFSHQKKPVEYSVDTLKFMFQVQDKYKLTADFIKYVIKPAKKELDVCSPYSFNFTVQKTGRKITSILFEPVHIPKNIDDDLERKRLTKHVDISWDLPVNITNYLQENYFFTIKEIKNNIQIFSHANKKIPDLLVLLANSKRIAFEKNNPKGWLIGLLKKKIS